ncbi:MAG: HEAT repeat domain-containing protein [Promethearchaeota archaeon]
MSKDLKDQINIIEKESKTYAQLEEQIHSLKERINHQKFTIKEQKLLIENLRSQMNNEELEKVKLPSEIDILKDLITSQRKEIDNKNSIIDRLNDKIFVMNSGLDSIENSDIQHINSEELIEAQRLIVNFTDENEHYKNNIEQLRAQIEKLQSEKSEIEEIIEDETKNKINHELKNFKRLNFQLMEENGLLRSEIEKLKNKLNGQPEITTSDDIIIANNKIAILTSEIEDLEAQIKYLQENRDKIDEPIVVSTEDALEFAKLREDFDVSKKELLEIQKENQNLRQIIDKLKEEKKMNSQKFKTDLSEVKGLSKNMKQSLFFRIYRLLDENSRRKVINSLIQDLKTGNSQIKKNSIKILTVLKNKKIYDTFLEMVNDKDWIIRYFIIKALSKFEDKNNELKQIFQNALNDIDVDVRELAMKILENLPNEK